MFPLACIVEGHGEVEAVPILIRRIAADVDPALVLQLSPVFRLPRGRMLKTNGLEPIVELAARRVGRLPPEDPEAVRGAKEWLSRHMDPGRRYVETMDQPALTSRFDLEQARRTDSFDKCDREIRGLLVRMKERFKSMDV